MNTAGNIVSGIMETLRLKDDETKSRIKRTLNSVMHDYAELESWYTLRKSITIDFSDEADSDNAVLLPANLAGIDGIWDDAGNEYHASERARGQMDTASYEDRRYRWFYADPVTDPLVFQSAAAVAKDATTYTCNPALAWSADYVGEYITFGNDPGFYKLTAEGTFTPAYRGTSLNSVYFAIRPVGTRRISLSDYNGAYTAATVTIFYWTYPDPVWNDAQRIPFPHSRAIELETLIRELGGKDKREAAADRYRAELYGSTYNPGGALGVLRSMNRKFIPPLPPRDRMGTRVRFSSR